MLNLFLFHLGKNCTRRELLVSVVVDSLITFLRLQSRTELMHNRRMLHEFIHIRNEAFHTAGGRFQFQFCTRRPAKRLSCRVQKKSYTWFVSSLYVWWVTAHGALLTVRVLHCACTLCESVVSLVRGGAGIPYLAHTILNVDPCCLSVHSSSASAVFRCPCPCQCLCLCLLRMWVCVRTKRFRSQLVSVFPVPFSMRKCNAMQELKVNNTQIP